MNSAGGIEQADRNLAGALRHFAEHSPAGAVEERDGVILFAGGHRYPGAYCNGVLRLDSSADPATVLDLARDFFVPRRRGYAVWIRGHADADLEREVRERGFFQRPPAEGMPGMVLSTQPTQAPSPPPDARIEAVADLNAAGEYLRVVAAAYEMGSAPPELAAGLLFEPSSVLARNVQAVLAHVDGRPAAGAMTIVTDGVAGLYWVATAPWARGRGLGAACAWHVTAAGFDLGAQMACLQASQMGARMWRSLGFAEVTRYQRYLAPGAPGSRRIRHCPHMRGGNVGCAAAQRQAPL
jgi:hypothetical protein